MPCYHISCAGGGGGDRDTALEENGKALVGATWFIAAVRVLECTA